MPVQPAPLEVDEFMIDQDPILRYFHYQHLPADLQEISKPFCDLAVALISLVPRNAERTMALRKMLEAKDCAVRANV